VFQEHDLHFLPFNHVIDVLTILQLGFEERLFHMSQPTTKQMASRTMTTIMVFKKYPSLYPNHLADVQNRVSGNHEIPIGTMLINSITDFDGRLSQKSILLNLINYLLMMFGFRTIQVR
jgi:hypothetical protein